MSYKYESPTKQGYKRIYPTKEEKQQMFKHHNWKIKYEYYENNDEYLRIEYLKWYIRLILVLYAPFYILWNGFSEAPEVIQDTYKGLFPKCTGSYYTKTRYKDKIKQQSIDGTISKIK